MHPLSSLNVGSYVISGLDRVETEHENDTAYDRDVHADFRVSGIKRLKRLFRVQPM
ncbi:hypothetical protein [Paraburkholderia dinghuensis]|uniref:hypothetical protein n=1 Tax=Paraburkholderia dinghuensis TaxID=2305225 RepID=UPI001625BF88|nr:hypothetical protein [Paraburkholderia dinghuensis]